MKTFSRRSWSRMLLVGCLVVVPFGSSAWAQRNFLTWDADSTAVQNPSGQCSSMPSATIDSSVRHEGTGSMRISVGDGQTHRGCQDYASDIRFDHALDDGSWIYYRWWMKLSPDFDWGNDYHQKMKSSRYTRGGQGAYFTGYLHRTGVEPISGCGDCEPSGMFSGGGGPIIRIDLDPTDGGCDVGGGAQCTDWNEYIVAYKWQTGSSMNAEAHVWVNGEHVGSMTDFRVHSGGGTNAVQNWGSWMTEPYSQLCPNGSSCGFGGTMWLDDYSTDDTWNSNVTARPEAPVSLLVD